MLEKRVIFSFCPVTPENSQTTNKNHTTNTTSSPTIVSNLTSTTVNQTTQPSPTENALHVANETNATVTSTIFPTSTEKPKFSDSSTPMKTGPISVQVRHAKYLEIP